MRPRPVVLGVRSSVIGSRFNAEGPDGRVTRKAIGAPSKLDDARRAALDHVVERGPDPEINDGVRWRLLDLAAWVWNSFGPSVSAATLSRERTALGFSKRSARPRHHAQDKGAGRVLPRCDSETMTAHIAVISAMVARGADAVVILDQAGWHLSGSLAIPANITLLP